MVKNFIGHYMLFFTVIYRFWKSELTFTALHLKFGAIIMFLLSFSISSVQQTVCVTSNVVKFNVYSIYWFNECHHDGVCVNLHLYVLIIKSCL